MQVASLPRWKLFWQQNLNGTPTMEPTPHETVLKSKTWQTNITRVESWPEEARPLKSHTWLTYLYAVGDCILVLLPLFFILLGVAVISLNGKHTKGAEFGTKVEFVMDLSPTLFPIVFAAIIGRSMKMIARYLAEKGTKISTLELLMASQSVWGTFESQLLMQRLTFVGANLLFLWTLSPLGGQASLRLMKRDLKETIEPVKLRYMTTGPAATMWGLSSTYVDSGKFSDAGALYTAALLAPLSIKTGSQDPWGNVKIPTFEYLNASTMDPNGWIDVPTTVSVPEAYSSLVGLPIVGLPSTKDSNFSMEYTYLVVNCSTFAQTPYPSTDGSTYIQSTNFTKLEELAPGQVWYNKSNENPFGDPRGDRTSFFIDTTRSFPLGQKEGSDHETYIGRLDGFFGNDNRSSMSESEFTTNRELLYVSQYSTVHDGGEHGLNIAKCAISQKHVEAAVRCNRRTCAVTKLRTSLHDNRAAAFTGFDHGTIMFSFAKQFPRAVTFSQGSSPTEHFLANTSSFPFVQQVGHLTSDVAFTNLSLISAEVFSRRLGLVMNTYYQVSVQPTGYFGDLPQNLSFYGPDTMPATDIDAYLPGNLSATKHTFMDWYYAFGTGTQATKSPFIAATTMAQGIATESIFVCNYAWLSLLFVASGVTLITGFAALVLKQKTLGPEMFGFVSSMTYENPWVRIPDGGTMLDAMERARLLKDVEVHVGDVCGDNQVGHIAFAAGVSLRKLERGRLYC